MFIVALYLVIKEHNICLRFFYVSTPWSYFSISIFFMCQGVHPTFPHASHISPLFLPYICIDSNLSIFITNLFSVSYSVCPSQSVSVRSVPVKHGHKSGRLLLISTKVDESSQRLNSHRLLLQSKRNTFQSLLQFCKKCVHFLFLYIT